MPWSCRVRDRRVGCMRGRCRASRSRDRGSGACAGERRKWQAVACHHGCDVMVALRSQCNPKWFKAGARVSVVARVVVAPAMAVVLELRTVAELRAIASVFAVDIRGIPEKKEIAMKLRQELTEKHNVTNPDSIHMRSPQASSAPTPPGQGLSPSPQEADHALSPMPMSLALDRQMTQDLAQTMFLAIQEELWGGERTWHNLPDGVGRFYLVHVSALYWTNRSPQFFYHSLTLANRRLVFECVRWKQPAVVLEPYIVLCYSRQQVVWPYCMLCHEFCDGDHMKSIRHQWNQDWWQLAGNDTAIEEAFGSKPSFPQFV